MKVKWHGAEYKMINATENDLQRIIDWKLDTIIGGYPGEDIPPNEKQRMINYVNKEAQMYLKNTRMILVDDQVVGMLIAYDKDGDWFIDDIYIIPEYRSRGIGFHVLCDECQEHETLSLYVYKTNTKAIRLYNRCGFSVTEVTGDRYFMRRDPNIEGESISYAMGVDNIDEVRLHMDIEDTNDGDYEVIFPSNRSWEWELFISEHLEDTYWNEYIDLKSHKIHFMFNENGIIDHVINNGFDENPELLNRCNRLCEQDFKTMKDLIYSNTFYRTTLEQAWGDKTAEPVNEAFFKEAYLKAKERNSLKDSEFGIPELRKYPLTDETHINMAVKFFGKAPKKYKLSLAKRILHAAHSHDMDTKDWDSINDYIKNHKESVVQEGFVDRTIKHTLSGLKIPKLQPVDEKYLMDHKADYMKLYADRGSVTASYYNLHYDTFKKTFGDKADELYDALENLFAHIGFAKDFNIYNKYRLFLCRLLNMPTNHVIALEGWYNRADMGQMRVKAKEDDEGIPLKSTDVLYHTSKIKGLTELQPTFVSRNAQDPFDFGKKLLSLEALYTSPRVYVGLNEPVGREGLGTSGLRIYKITNFKGKVKYDHELTGSAARFIETKSPVKVVDVTEEYLSNHIKESYTERKNFIMKEQITKILEAYNSGVLTQEEASEKIEAIQEEYAPKSGAEKSKVEEMKENWDEDYFQKLEKLATDEKSKMNPKNQRDYQALYEELKKYRPKKTTESATMDNLREKQDKIMESFKMGIINGTEGMRLIERVMMEADYITEEEDTAYEGDDDNEPEDITPEDADGDTVDSDDTNIDALADYINSLSDDEKTALMSKLSGSDEPTDDDADGNEEVPEDDASVEGEPTTEETVDPASVSDASLNDSNASLDDMEV